MFPLLGRGQSPLPRPHPIFDCVISGMKWIARKCSMHFQWVPLIFTLADMNLFHLLQNVLVCEDKLSISFYRLHPHTGSWVSQFVYYFPFLPLGCTVQFFNLLVNPFLSGTSPHFHNTIHQIATCSVITWASIFQRTLSSFYLLVKRERSKR